MSATASRVDDKPAHFALYYLMLDAAQVIPIGPLLQIVTINGATAPTIKAPL